MRSPWLLVQTELEFTALSKSLHNSIAEAAAETL